MDDEKFLLTLKFKKNKNKYVKIYNGYKIEVDENFIVNYGNQIRKDRSTTTNLCHQKESKVVFQCVDRLLELGYKPKSIYLEKSYSAGRTEHGQFLDILIFDTHNNPYMMIECKTQEEFNSEIDKMQENGGQLFTYFKNDRGVKYLCLYTSSIQENGEIVFLSQIVKTSLLTGNNKEELYNSWDKTFENKGIFEPLSSPYSIEFCGIKKNELKLFSDFDINVVGQKGTFFNRFKEILRHNSISDKNNAYNKIFNLFLCKIVDEEERQDNEDMWFQWKDCETAEDMLSRLNDLYKRGMDKYLELEISDFSESELEELLNEDWQSNDEIKKMFRKLRLYKNNEFAFLEVINERTFADNAKIVKEIVKLLEPYKIKMSSKKQFLGDFFEKLLSLGVKQESGQFFTPIPIANFIVNSIPIEKIIESKINNLDEDFLPYFIDYACGGGHFLTEGMHRVDKVVKNLQNNNLKTNSQKNNLPKWQKDYGWAGTFVYGVELDYRLAKTTKVACFLNGDGDANIMYANGIDTFDNPNYRGILKSDKKNKNDKFDIVIANPPYSVKDFKKNINDQGSSFTISRYLTDKSDDIETLFIERTHQLLKDGGYCGVILPDTILINSTPEVYSKSRKFILTYFDIVGITHLGEQTFIATGQTTISLFAKKRRQSTVSLIINKAKEQIEKFISRNILFEELKDYISTIYEGYDSNQYKEYLTLSNIKIKENEIEQFAIYMLNKNKKIVISTTGKRTQEIEFLGYKHTDKKNYEGIRPYPDNDENIIISKLYNENDIFDKSRLSYYIYQNFLEKDIDIKDIFDNRLNENVRVENINDIINFNSELEEFDEKKYDEMLITKNIYPIKYDKELYDEIKLENLIGKNNIGTGGNAPKPRFFVTEEKKDSIFIRAKHLNNTVNNYINLDRDNYFLLDSTNRILVKKGTILFPKSGQSVNTNNIAMVNVPCYVVNHLATLWCENDYLREYIFYLLRHYKTSSMKLTDTGYPTIRLSTIRNLMIPIPKDNNYKKIVDELKIINRDGVSKERIFNLEEKVLKKFKLVY